MPERQAIVTVTMTALAGLGAILTALTLVWMLSVRLRDASIADVCWGLGFVLLAWLYCLLSPTLTPRAWLVATLITLWGVRLSLTSFAAIMAKARTHAIRRCAPRMGGRSGGGASSPSSGSKARSSGSSPFRFLSRCAPRGPPLSPRSTALESCSSRSASRFEVVGDYQLERFRAEPSNRGTVLDRGLWRYTRHPNYFGDATMWWGMYAMAAATPGGWLTVLSPALMTLLLMRVSGVTLLEDSLKASKPGYRAYIARTPAFFPWFPRVPR